MNASDLPVLLWIRSPPHSTVHLTEGVRLAAMATALDIPVRWLFIGEGVRALVQGQEPYLYAPPLKRILAGIVSAELPALVHAPSLQHRGIEWGGLVDGVPFTAVDDAGAAEWLIGASRVVPL